jgi:hypothetical protein
MRKVVFTGERKRLSDPVKYGLEVVHRYFRDNSRVFY